MTDDWDPYHLQNRWAAVNNNPSSHIPHTDADPISIELMSCKMREIAISHQILHTICNCILDVNEECDFSTTNRVNFSESDSLTPEQLRVMWQIG